MRLTQPVLELLRGDRPPPQIAMLLSACGNDAQAPARPRADPAPADAVDNRGVHFILGPVAIHRSTWRAGDDRAASTLQGSPNETVDKRVFEGCERSLSVGREGDQPIGILSTGMRDGEEDRQVSARLVYDRGGEFAHGLRLNFVPV